MASFRPNKRGKKCWLARRKRDYEEHFLGYYETKEEALRAESIFDECWPRGEK